MFTRMKTAFAWSISAAALFASGLAWSGPNGQPMFYDGCLPDNIETALYELKVTKSPASYRFTSNLLSIFPVQKIDYGVTVWRAPCPQNANRRVVMMKVTSTFASPVDSDAVFDVIVAQRGADVGSFRFRVSSSATQTDLCASAQRIGSVVSSRFPAGSMLWWDSPRKPDSFYTCQQTAFPLEPASKESIFDVDAPFELTFRRVGGESTVVPVSGSADPGDAVIAGNQRGVWWNPEQSGWALAVDRNDRGVTFASWITYDEQGRPTWYVMPDGEAIGPNIVEGNVFHPVGPEFASTFTAASARLGEPVGKFRIEWTHIDQSLDADRNDERGVFTFDVKGVKGTTPIRRFLYQERSRAKVCSDFRGMYWNPGESGWGIVFEGGGSVYDCPLFAAWLTYEGAEGRPTWFVMPNSKLYDEFFPRTHRGSLYRPTGPSLSSVFDPKQVKLGDPVGSLVVDTTIPATLVGNGFQALYYTGFYPVSFRVTMNGLNGAAIQKKIRPMRFEF